MIWTIYQIKNLVNNKIYVGQTIRDLNERFRKHCTQNRCKKIYRAIKKYGEKNFTIEPLAFCFSKLEADETEEEFIKFKKSIINGYNICLGGNSSWLGLTHSEKSKQKMSNSHKGKKSPHVSENNKKRIGTKRTDLTKLKMSIAQTGKTMSKDSCLKMSEAKKGCKWIIIEGKRKLIKP